MDLSPLVILASFGFMTAFVALAVLFGADSRESMLDDHLR
jgi:hypothetical protein